MNLSKKWLNDYYKISVSDKEFADVMTMTGSKVEGIHTEGADLDAIVVGKIVSLEKHADSDHLWVCAVDVGGRVPVQIVTGAQNIKANDYVPVALDGACVHGGKRIQSGSLRGVISEGMLCSLNELGLSLNDFPYACEDGIFVLGDDCTKDVGKDIRDAIGYNDVITEFEITSNRPDCLSVVGLAREAAASFGDTLCVAFPVVHEGHGNAHEILSVEIHDSEKCSRYIGAVVENVRIAPSPLWMRERLRASGVRPINNIVDITNYVMLEYGQPMHAFDLRYIDGTQIHVRTAEVGETITTLDGIERTLCDDMLVIADAAKPVAVAGVMGGEYSGIMDDTKTLVFESACFNATSVRSTSKRLGMRTESSSRFEKGLDAVGCERSIRRALELVQMLDAGDVVEGLVDCDRSVDVRVTLPFDWEWINTFIGIETTKERQKRIFENLEFTVTEDTVTPPSFRGDIEHLADLSEEVARFYGYENIPNRPLSGEANGKLTEKQLLEKRVSETLLACGLSEIQTYSFVSKKVYDRICLPSDSCKRNCVEISNPLGEETSVMRTTPLPSMLEVLSRNYNYRNAKAALFEIATEYIPHAVDELPSENQKITLGFYGSDYDFFTLKGVVEELMDSVGLGSYAIESVEDNPSFHPGRCAILSVNGRELAILGEIHPRVQTNYEIGSKVYAAVIDFNCVFDNRNPRKIYKALPKFPAVTRDLAFLCNAEIPVLTLETLISDSVGDLLEDIALFDVYTGEQIPAGMKSVAYTLRLRSHEKTLTDLEAEEAVQRAVTALKKAGYELRG